MRMYKTSEKQKMNRRGFTLLEVLIVVLIAVLVTMAAIPMYKRNQDRNRYMAASAVLVEMAEAMRLAKEAYPSTNLNISGTFSSNNIITDSSNPGDLGTAPTTWAGLQSRKYMSYVPFENGKYMGYTFKYNIRGSVTCGNSCKGGSAAVACMTGTNSITGLNCAWVDKYGNVTHK